MAQIHEEIVVLNFSELVKNGEKPGPIITPENLKSIETVLQDLLGDGIIVEATNA